MWVVVINNLDAILIFILKQTCGYFQKLPENSTICCLLPAEQHQYLSGLLWKTAPTKVCRKVFPTSRIELIAQSLRVPLTMQSQVDRAKF